MIIAISIFAIISYFFIGFFGTGIANKFLFDGQITSDGWWWGTVCWPFVLLIFIVAAPFYIGHKIGIGRALWNFIDWSERPRKKTKKDEITA